MPVAKHEDGEVKAETENFSDVLWIKNREETKQQKVMGKNNVGEKLGGSKTNKQNRRDIKNAVNVGNFEEQKNL